MKPNLHHVLLVDDDLDQQFLSRRALVKALAERRSTVHLVASGREAIAYMIGEGAFADRERHPFPTVIITDLNMPDGDGFHVLEFVQCNPQWSVVPRIMLSSSDNDDDVRTAFALGASAYHLKGSDVEACMRRIVEYWTSSEVPPVDQHGRLYTTVNLGGPGSRYQQAPRGHEKMRRPIEGVSSASEVKTGQAQSGG